MRYRTIKISPEGKTPRSKVREAVRGVHLIPVETGAWEVRTMGMNGFTSKFQRQQDALDFAESLVAKRDSSLVIHRKDGVVRDTKTAGQVPS